MDDLLGGLATLKVVASAGEIPCGGVDEEFGIITDASMLYVGFDN